MKLIILYKQILIHFLMFQLVSSLAKETIHVSIDLIRVPNVGWCLRFNPLVSAESKFGAITVCELYTTVT